MFKLSFDESTNKDLLVKGSLEELFNSTDRSKFVEYPNVFKEVKVDVLTHRNLRLAGLPQGGEVQDGVNIPTYDPVYGGTKEHTQKRFGSGFTYTTMMKKFEQYDIIGQLTRHLKVTQYEMKDIEVAKLINAPTATTYGSGFDGFALLYASHPCLDEDTTTFSNLATADLSRSSLLDAYIYFDTIVDDQADMNPGKPNKLIVPPQLRFTAKELLGSTNVPYEQSNTTNVLPDMNLSTFVYHRMTDDDAWFLADTTHEKYGLTVWTSQEPDIVVQDSPNTARNTYVTSQQMFSYGFDDSRYIYGSVPA